MNTITSKSSFVLVLMSKIKDFSFRNQSLSAWPVCASASLATAV